jgi:hypothetical protein
MSAYEEARGVADRAAQQRLLLGIGVLPQADVLRQVAVTHAQVMRTMLGDVATEPPDTAPKLPELGLPPGIEPTPVPVCIGAAMLNFVPR